MRLFILFILVCLSFGCVSKRKPQLPIHQAYLYKTVINRETGEDEGYYYLYLVEDKTIEWEYIKSIQALEREKND